MPLNGWEGSIKAEAASFCHDAVGAAGISHVCVHVHVAKDSMDGSELKLLRSASIISTYSNIVNWRV